VVFGTVLVGLLCFGDFSHGIALVIHRAWSKLGFKLWTWLAWLITFNFVNIAWVFFRAKEWDDAIKVLGNMFSIDIPVDFDTTQLFYICIFLIIISLK